MQSYGQNNWGLRKIGKDDVLVRAYGENRNHARCSNEGFKIEKW